MLFCFGVLFQFQLHATIFSKDPLVMRPGRFEESAEVSNWQLWLSFWNSDKEHLDEVVGNLTSYMTVQTLPTVAMVNLISRCQRVDRPPLSRSSGAAKGRGDKSSRALKMEPVTPPPMGQSFITAIVPGTCCLHRIFHSRTRRRAAANAAH